MKIAFLGWGSLIWDPRNLRTKGDWHDDGPSLPIEFRRISKGGRITLVIHPDADEVQTLWAEADFSDISEARENLRSREGTILERIGYISIKDNKNVSKYTQVAEKIRAWAKEKGLDGVVWTDLTTNPKKFKEETGMEMTDDNIVKHLDSAREYVQKTPEQIDTPLRRKIIQELEW